MKKLYLLLLFPLLLSNSAYAGQQSESDMTASMRDQLYSAMSNQAPEFLTDDEKLWVHEMMSNRTLIRKVPDPYIRTNLLKTIAYESKRAGLDKQLVMGLVQVESGFNKYAISPVKAMGYMQVMPFWAKAVSARHNLFDMRTNIRYGCNILSLYVGIERGNIIRGLQRYNGSLGRPVYSNLVLGAARNWGFNPQRARYLALK